MQYLKADTAVKVVIGPVVAVGDGFTPVTTLSLSTADEAEIMKHDAAAVTDISGNTFTAITSMRGYYNLTITAAQLDTEGMLTVGINDDSLCLPVRSDYMVVNANVYGSLFAAATTDYLQVDTIQVGGATEDIATETKQDVIDTNVDAILVDTNSLNDTKIPDTISLANINAEVDSALDTAIPGVPTANSINERIKAIDDLSQSGGSGDLAAILTDTADMQPKLGSPVADLAADIATVDSNVDAIKVVTDEQANHVISGTCGAGSTVTNVVSGLTTVADQFNGKIITFSEDTSTAALQGQSTDITDTDASGNLTVTALTNAPASGDTYIIT